MTNKNNTMAVVGAGIVGVCCAVELQKLGYQVTLIDKEDIGAGCSKGNAGHFATEQVFPLAEPSLLWQLPKLLLDPLGPVAISPRYFAKAIPWFTAFIANMTTTRRKKNTQALRALNELAISAFKPLLTEANAEHFLTLNGSLLVFESTDLNEVTKVYQHYKSQGVAVKLLDREQTFALEPNLNANINYSLYFTNVGHTIEPYELCKTIAQYGSKLGVNFQQFNLKEITQEKDQVVISNGVNNMHFDQVLITTGADSKALLASFGYKLPMEVERGYHLNLTGDKAQQLLSRPVASAERKFIATPMAFGLRLAGTVEFAGLKQKANFKRADILHKNAQYVLNAAPNYDPKLATEQQRWMGFRPSLPDSLPVICRAPRHQKIYFALGHQHLGLTLAAITAKLVGQIATNQATEIDIAPYCISRFN